MSYNYISNLKSKKIQKKSVLIIGSGYIAQEYAKSLDSIGIKDVTILGNRKYNVNRLCKKFNFEPISGGFSKNLQKIPKKDLVIIATPIPLLLDAAESAIKNGQSKILLEKPAALSSKRLKIFSKQFSSQNISIAYNRLSYPNLLLLVDLIKKDGGAISCHFDFTEWTEKINFNIYPKSITSRWGISNSLHVISMTMKIIGMPKIINCYRYGNLSWHSNGAIFIGNGVSKKNIPFSYHSNWNSSGRWLIEIKTKKYSYRLSPLESLYLCKKGTLDWKIVNFKKSFPDTKNGISEQIITMLDPNSKHKLPSIKEGIEYLELAEKIFGY